MIGHWSLGSGRSCSPLSPDRSRCSPGFFPLEGYARGRACFSGPGVSLLCGPHLGARGENRSCYSQPLTSAGPQAEGSAVDRLVPTGWVVSPQLTCTAALLLLTCPSTSLFPPGMARGSTANVGLLQRAGALFPLPQVFRPFPSEMGAQQSRHSGAAAILFFSVRGEKSHISPQPQSNFYRRRLRISQSVPRYRGGVVQYVLGSFLLLI
ncbi:hypothetical protein NDU88_005185 [Pleurodeles waltl]|uniref:Uncharacterized protein n=1 Tax=Pleurodeles waltl TaxID=8319 RepID=A0AAV7SL37_PLEWA|nr:hypothetical protein NDU88_005185 [Pleurodeles waltl]